MQRDSLLSLPHKAGFEADSSHTFDFARDLVVAIDQSDWTGLCASFENLSPFEWEVFNKYDAVAVRNHVPIRVFYGLSFFGLGLARPFMAACHTFPIVGMLKYLSLIHI